MKKDRRGHGSFDPAAFKEVREIVNSAQKDNEDAYQKALNNLVPEQANDSTKIKNVNPFPDQAKDSAKIKNIDPIPERANHSTKIKNVDLLSDQANDSAKIKNTLTESDVKGILMGPRYSNLKEQEKIHDLIHSQPRCKKHLEKKDEQFENALDIEPSELVSLCQDAIKQGILDPEVSQARRPINSSGYTWRKESSRFRDFEYRYQADPDLSRSNRTITPNSCHIGIARFEDIGDGTIWVRIEVSEAGQRHPQCYVSEALESDPASRLAFKLRYQPSSGPEVTRFGHRGGFQAIYAANTLVDILVDGKSYQEIAKTPRRYIFLGDVIECPDELQRFRKGGYTDGCDLTGKKDSAE